jgi:hypothetical protein
VSHYVKILFPLPNKNCIDRTYFIFFIDFVLGGGWLRHCVSRTVQPVVVGPFQDPLQPGPQPGGGRRR